MTKVKNPDHCYVCGKPLSDDYESVKVPSGFNIRPSVHSEPGVIELRFCCERHKQDWGETQYGTWRPDTDEE